MSNLKKLENVFWLDLKIQDEKAYDFAYTSLKNRWKLPDDFISKVASNFLCATEGNIFLEFYDGADDIDDAWERYCDFRGIEHEKEFNPFNIE